ncbi:MAG: AAA-like domain-containing protein [Anaerolineae bacterium]|nr:AAA-like domain-containing protein [Anaerolineae bacterium]
MNKNPPRQEDFFKAGGALDPDSPSYVERDADAALYNLALSGEYCNVLTSRQMGKTTLIARTRQRLENEGVQSVFIDLTAISSPRITPAQWFYSLISVFCNQLGLEIDPQDWWNAKNLLAPIQRLTEFLQQVVLEQVQGRIVVFIDEIDTTLKLPFTDDFFAAIRAMHNQRAIHEKNERLTFVLVGVARPTDLIKDPKGIPFNIGQLVSLSDFTRENAETLLPGLESVYSTAQAQAVLDRILYWTSGHPYLTQKLCEEAVKSSPSAQPDRQIDVMVERLFLREGKQLDDPNPNSVNAYLRASEYHDQALEIYREVLSGRLVKDDDHSLPMSELKLSGLVKVDQDGCLQVKNRIYERIFGRQWAGMQAPEPAPKTRRAIWLPIAGLVVVIAAFAIWRPSWLPWLRREATPSPTRTQVALVTPVPTNTPSVVLTETSAVADTPTPVDTPAATSTTATTNTPIPPTPTTSPTSAGTPTPTSTPTLAPTLYAVTTGDPVRLRAGPGTIYDTLQIVTSGVEMPVVGRTSPSDWWQVDYEGQLVWVLAELVDVPPGSDAVPVVTDLPPTPTFTPTPVPPAPVLVEPESGARFEDKVRFKFTWVRRLHDDENFSIYVRSADGSQSYVWWVGEADILSGGGAIYTLTDGVLYEVESGIGMLPSGEAFWRVAALPFPTPENPTVNWSEERQIYKK